MLEAFLVTVMIYGKRTQQVERSGYRLRIRKGASTLPRAT